ncbi:pimeloyl-ACP methyl ester carboxylesterase [Streptomyces olivoverticillatus]|uniref:Pimeloyl-ACP methyl ester carboxylesterase n=1 Tax=Streptomyces olivoverticillatus TaxID=66427 RepID=A0A7W7PNA8_9ACTN|nr:alpha/beta hydrolase [Streptomyces olivoverticillatus]MBB4894650.1 pimeloyl-ACP methyl ester carboxylesterase [Streptomyces olivoverticillatus]
MGICLALGAFGAGGLLAVDSFRSSDEPCDQMPTDIATSDYALDFSVPAGLMPDRRFDGQKAQLHVHRVQPKYQHGRCAQTPVRAAVLIHGRTVPGPVAFDLKGADQDHNKLSVQAGLAREGIDTFAPSLLGYGQSTRFKDGLDDPDNASLRAFRSDGSCAFAEGCDRTHNPVFPLDQQGTKLSTNPLAGQRYAHSSKVRFAGTDVWVRDVRQAIDDAIAKAHPTDGKVTLLGYSLGGNRVGRALYANNPNPLLPKSSDTIAKVNRVVFLSSFYGGTTEESTPSGGFVSFPLTLTDHQGTSDGWKLASGTTEQDCPGRIVNGSQDETWKELMQQDGRGRDWGGTDPHHPAGLNRSPTFSTYGWNSTVAGQLTVPALVIHGIDDGVLPVTTSTTLYDQLPASMQNKVLVQIKCASHTLLAEGCTGARCKPPASATVYGQAPNTTWAGPHATLNAALIEWITKGTFDGEGTGKFTVDKSGVVHRQAAATG